MQLSNEALEQNPDMESKDNQTLTEASSEINGQWWSVISSKKQQEPTEEETTKNKGENKLKYRKLTQRLNTMGHQHEDKYMFAKDVITPNKQRIMKYVIEFQRQLKSQNKDQYQYQFSLREIYKIIEGKNEQDLHLLRNCRLIPVFFQLLHKVPSMHKNQMAPAMRVVQLGLKIVHIFSTLAVNRDYLILTKRLKNLLSLASWMLGRDERKCIYMCFKLMNILLLHKNRQQPQIKIITTTTIQLIIFSQIFKKIKLVIQQTYSEGYIVDTELNFEILRFVYNILKSRRQDQRLTNDGIPIYQQQLKSDSSIYPLIQFVLQFFTKYLVMLGQDEQIGSELNSLSSPPQLSYNMSSIEINTYLLVLKIINTSFELSYSLSKKQIDLSILIPFFVQTTIYCKNMYQDVPTPQQSNLFNELIILIGYVALDNEPNQRLLHESSLIEELFNLPIQFLMDSHLKDIIMPTICCLLHTNKTTINLFLKDNSSQPILKYLKKESQSQSNNLTRKNSTHSLLSLALGPHEALISPISHQIDRLKLINRFPYHYWNELCGQLERYASMDG